MSFDEVMAELPKLTPAERRELRLQLARMENAQWQDRDDPLTESEKALLEARLEEYAKDPEAGGTWAEVEARIRSRFKS